MRVVASESRRDQNVVLRSGGKKRREIGIPVTRNPYRFPVDNLLPRQPDLRGSKPNSGMKPEQGPQRFFQQMEQPIAAADVNPLMSQDGVLLLRGQGKPRRAD